MLFVVDVQENAGMDVWRLLRRPSVCYYREVKDILVVALQGEKKVLNLLYAV